MHSIGPEQFLEQAKTHAVLDVRSPAEFLQGHIPGSISFPLFTDEERKRVGIVFKNSGKEASVLLGLDFVGPKMSSFVKSAREIAPSREVLVHCWRGGMRSAAMAWLLETAGFNVKILTGGYKAYRRYIRQETGSGYRLIILGGYTGTGKSEILKSLKVSGQQVLDLEQLASHKGSAFGDLAQRPQPTNEQFENTMIHELLKFDTAIPVWVEDESRSIGIVSIPDPFYLKMKESTMIFLDMEKEKRVDNLVREYSDFDPILLENAIIKVSEKLGGLNTTLSIEALHQKEYRKVVTLLLGYYDKAYLAGLEKRNKSTVVYLKPGSHQENYAEMILHSYENLFHVNAG